MTEAATPEVKAPTKTQLIVAAMLTENTGRHMLDSGGAYGRNWERNQGKNVEAFEKEPKYSVEFFARRRRYPYTHPDKELRGKPMPGSGELDVSATVSLYYWMTTMLEFDEDLQKELEAFAARDDQKDESWFDVVENWVNSSGMKARQKAEPFVENTYNNTDHWDLSQVIQYVGLYLEDNYAPSHIIVQVHGGCDVRGGYTAPKVFKNNGSDSLDYLEAGHANEVYTKEGRVNGQCFWSFEGWLGSWSQTHKGDENFCDVEEFKDMPVYSSDWLEDPKTDPIPFEQWFIVVHENRAFLLYSGDLSPKDIKEIHEGEAPWDVIGNELAVGNCYI